MAARVTYIQPGWTVRARDGHDLGRVVELSHDAVLVLDDHGHRRTVPKADIEEEDEGAMLAILAIDAGDLDEGTSAS